MNTRRPKGAVAVALLVMSAVNLGAAKADSAATTVAIPDGWEALDQEYRYGPDDLWQYINGAAELFLDYGFQELLVRDLGRGVLFEAQLSFGCNIFGAGCLWWTVSTHGCGGVL